MQGCSVLKTALVYIFKIFPNGGLNEELTDIQVVGIKINLASSRKHGRYSVKTFLISTSVSNSMLKFRTLETENFAMSYINLCSYFRVFSPLCPCRQDTTQEIAIITRQWLIGFRMHTHHLNVEWFVHLN